MNISLVKAEVEINLEVLDAYEPVELPSETLQSEPISEPEPELSKPKDNPVVEKVEPQLEATEEAKPADDPPMLEDSQASLQTITVSFLPDKTDVEQSEKDSITNALKELDRQYLWADIYAYSTESESNQSEIRRLALERGIAVKEVLQAAGIKERHINILPIGAPEDMSEYDRANIILYKRR